MKYKKKHSIARFFLRAVLLVIVAAIGLVGYAYFKKNLIVQLVDYEETKAENERLRRQLLIGVTVKE